MVQCAERGPWGASQEAAAALAMQGMTVMGTQLRVELVRSAVNASSQGRPEAPFAIMHAHQVAQLQMVRLRAQGWVSN